VTRVADTTVPDDLNWRYRLARAAAQDIGQDAAGTITERAGQYLKVETGFFLLWAMLGAAGGWLATATLLRPDEGLVNPVWTLLLIVGGPWGYLMVKYFVLLFADWGESSDRDCPGLIRVSLVVIERLVSFVPQGDSKPSGQRDSADRSLSESPADGIMHMLKNGSGRPLAAAGSGTYWTAYAVMAVLAIWFGTAHVALGFAWESSWIQPSYFRAVIENVPLIGSGELTPIAAAPVAPYEDPAAMEARQAWVRFLSAGVAIYLLLPMCVCTLVQFVHWRLRASLWRPRLQPSLVEARPCTHIVRLGQSAGTELPEPLQRLDDLGNLATDDDLERVRGAVCAHEARFAVVSCWSANEERGEDEVRQWLETLAGAPNETPLLVLSVDKKRRQSKPDGALPGCLGAACSLASYVLWQMPGCRRWVQGCSLAHGRTVADSLDAWDKLAQETNVALLECNLAAVTAGHEDYHLLVEAIGQQAAATGDSELAQRGPTIEFGSEAASTADDEPVEHKPVTESESEPGSIGRLIWWPVRWPRRGRRRPEDAMGQQAAATGDSEPVRHEPTTESGAEPRGNGRLSWWLVRWPRSRRRPSDPIGQQAAATSDSEPVRHELATESGAEPRNNRTFSRWTIAAKKVLPTRWPWRRSRS